MAGNIITLLALAAAVIITKANDCKTNSDCDDEFKNCENGKCVCHVSKNVEYAAYPTKCVYNDTCNNTLNSYELALCKIKIEKTNMCIMVVNMLTDEKYGDCKSPDCKNNTDCGDVYKVCFKGKCICYEPGNVEYQIYSKKCVYERPCYNPPEPRALSSNPTQNIPVCKTLIDNSRKCRFVVGVTNDKIGPKKCFPSGCRVDSDCGNEYKYCQNGNCVCFDKSNIQYLDYPENCVYKRLCSIPPKTKGMPVCTITEDHDDETCIFVVGMVNDKVNSWRKCTPMKCNSNQSICPFPYKCDENLRCVCSTDAYKQGFDCAEESQCGNPPFPLKQVQFCKLTTNGGNCTFLPNAELVKDDNNSPYCRKFRGGFWWDTISYDNNHFAHISACNRPPSSFKKDLDCKMYDDASNVSSLCLYVKNYRLKDGKCVPKQ